MRHGVHGRKLKRTSAHKKALLRNMATSLLKHKRIHTTLAKAKELREYVEPIITKARKGDLHNQRLIMQAIKDKEVVKELLSEIVTTIGDRKGGYTRIVRIGNRRGDGAEAAMIELVDYNAVMNEKAKENQENKQKAKDAKEEQKRREVEDAKVLEETSKA
jgi:large subunit ribosomal protein L17